MSEENNKSQNQEQPVRFDQQQYDLLKKCSDKKDMTEWNQWREKHPDEVIWLQSVNFKGWHLQGANFMHGNQPYEATGTYISFGEVHLERAVFEWANLQDAVFAGAYMNKTRFWSSDAKNADFSYTRLTDAEMQIAHFEGCRFCESVLRNARFNGSWLNGANFMNADIRGCKVRGSVVDGATKLWNCSVNRYSRNECFTDFSGTALDNVIIEPPYAKGLLEYNIRRMNWEEWYKEHPRLKWLVKLFWWMSDYGRSTGRIIVAFLGFAFGFAIIYWLWGCIAPPGIVDYLFVDGNGVEIVWWLVPIRAIHFSVVIMTVGFTNMHANAHSMWAHILVSLQMILGFVLLGALVTRFAVLFTAGGPAGKFADEDKKEDADNGNSKVFGQI